MTSILSDHDVKVKAIAGEVRAMHAAGRPFAVYHGSTNSTRIVAFKKTQRVDISALNRILTVDPIKRTVIAEPNVPMDKLVAATLRHQLLPPVIMEFPGITVGGGIQGGAGESSSFRWGCFNETLNWQEMILADGQIKKVSPTQSPDLFYGSAGSLGTLGVVTAAEIQLIPAKKYVHLTYHPVKSFAEAVQVLKTLAKPETGWDYIDGIMFAAAHGVIIAGKLSDEHSGPLHRFSRAHDSWYYLHANQIALSAVVHTETVPILDYLFRYDRGAFWMGRQAFERFSVPFNGFTRFVLNPLLHTRKLYQALQASAASQEYIVQDLGLPLKHAAKFMEFIDKSYSTYPLWLCPIKPSDRSALLFSYLQTPLVINIGVWGPRIREYGDFLAANRTLETKLHAFGGRKWFYAQAFYNEAKFWQIYGKSWYDALRTKYHATTLPTIYDKAIIRKRYDVHGRRGAVQALFGLAKLRVTD